MPALQASTYSASKAAVDAITVSLSQEIGQRKIRVNSLNPGRVETEGLRASGLHEGEFREQPEDIAVAATFLAGDDARWDHWSSYHRRRRQTDVSNPMKVETRNTPPPDLKLLTPPLDGGCFPKGSCVLSRHSLAPELKICRCCHGQRAFEENPRPMSRFEWNRNRATADARLDRMES